MFDRHSSTSHAAYHDLLRSLLTERTAALKGTPTREARRGRYYWYDSYRVGVQVKKTYIGEDGPALAAQIATHRTDAAQSTARATHQSRLVRLLRADGFMTTDAASGSLYAAMAKIGVFRLGGTIVGTHAFRQGEIDLRYSFDQMAQTYDLDIAQFERLSLVIDDVVERPLADTFKDFDFKPQPTLSKSVWRWRQTRSNTLIEFLILSFRDDEDIRDLPALGERRSHCIF